MSLSERVHDYIFHKRDNDKQVIDLIKEFKETLPSNFREDSPDQVKRIAQIILTNMLIEERETKGQEINKMNLDYSMFME